MMTPGPVLIPEKVRITYGAPAIHHRTPLFEKDLRFVLDSLPKIFQTQQPAYIHTSTGTGGMESALVNTLSPGDTVLVLEIGKFGQRWTEIAQALGLSPIVLASEWGHPANLEEVQKALDQNPNIQAVLCQACETSTGVLNPIQELGKIVSQTNAILIVDAIAALGATDLPMDEWNLDIIIGGSQKALMLPTGLSVLSFSQKARDRFSKSQLPKFYWSIEREHKANLKNQTFCSSPVSLIWALKASLEIILEMGLPSYIKRHEIIGKAIRSYGNSLGLHVLAQTPSPTATAFLLPDSISGDRLQSIMAEKYGITIAGGQDHLKGKIIRMGHMGDLKKEDIHSVFYKLSQALNELGHTCHFEKQESLLEGLPELP